MVQAGFPLSDTDASRHFAVVRVPIPVVIFLVVAVVTGVWWSGTRDVDFTTPPSDEKLKEIRTRVESSFPQMEKTDDTISQPAAPPEPEKPVVVEPAKPPINPGDLSVPATLNQYND